MPHAPTRACEPDHCYIHHEDEPAETTTAIVCGECGHMYPDPVELISADAQLRLELELSPLSVEAVAGVLDHLTEDPGRVFRLVPSCPACSHDF